MNEILWIHSGRNKTGAYIARSIMFYGKKSNISRNTDKGPLVANFLDKISEEEFEKLVSKYYPDYPDDFTIALFEQLNAKAEVEN